MKRGKKLLINLSIIMLILLVEYYLGGYYISKEKCIQDTLRGLYAYETENIMEFKKGKRIITLMANLDKKTYSIVSVKRNGFLYHTDDCFTGHPIEDNNTFDVLGVYDEDTGSFIGIYRNDKSITKVTVGTENAEVVTLDDWKQDFAGCLYEEDMMLREMIYRAYNASGELVEERVW